MKEAQTFKNHVRWYPPFHFILAPLMLINLIYWAVRLYQEPGWDKLMLVVLGVALIMLMLISRLFALTNQDRLIRLEERLRYERLLSPELAEKAAALRTHQMIALRFASDEELAGLVERTLAGEFSSQKEIKMSVTDWRADYHRV